MPTFSPPSGRRVTGADGTLVFRSSHASLPGADTPPGYLGSDGITTGASRASMEGLGPRKSGRSGVSASSLAPAVAVCPHPRYKVPGYLYRVALRQPLLTGSCEAWWFDTRRFEEDSACGGGAHLQDRSCWRPLDAAESARDVRLLPVVCHPCAVRSWSSTRRAER